MVFMLQSGLREPVAKIIDPIAKVLIKMRITPNWISLVGGLGSSISALILFSSGKFLMGVIAVSFFALFDLFDGTVARLSTRGSTKWGALLDSTLDRISDAAILIGGMIYFQNRDELLVKIFLVAIVSSFMVSYVKARAEALQIQCNGGIAERTERLLIILTAYGVYDLGFSNAINIGVYLLATLATITVIQRIIIIYRGSLK